MWHNCQSMWVKEFVSPTTEILEAMKVATICTEHASDMWAVFIG